MHPELGWEHVVTTLAKARKVRRERIAIYPTRWCVFELRVCAHACVGVVSCSSSALCSFSGALLA